MHECEHAESCLPVRFDEVVARLRAALLAPLPGATAHDRLSPRPRRVWPTTFDPARIRHAASLLLLFPSNDLAHLVQDNLHNAYQGSDAGRAFSLLCQKDSLW